MVPDALKPIDEPGVLYQNVPLLSLGTLSVVGVVTTATVSMAARDMQETVASLRAPTTSQGPGQAAREG
jgi:hypothetical protein